METVDPIELVEVRLSFLATRGELEPPARDGIVTSGGAVVGELDVLLGVFGEDREMETTPSPKLGFLPEDCRWELWFTSTLALLL